MLKLALRDMVHMNTGVSTFMNVAHSTVTVHQITSRSWGGSLS